MFIATVQAVCHDEGFSFPSDPAKNAQLTASQLLPWCSDAGNVEAVTSFVSELFKMFDRCINCSKRKVSHSKYVEKIWGAFHMECCLPAYAASWSTFYQVVFIPLLIPSFISL